MPPMNNKISVTTMIHIGTDERVAVGSPVGFTEEFLISSLMAWQVPA
jgi:hypothetical protein